MIKTCCFFLIVSFSVCLGKDLVCDSMYVKEKIEVGEGDIFKFSSSASSRYNASCRVKYQPGPGCNEMSFVCSALEIPCDDPDNSIKIHTDLHQYQSYCHESDINHEMTAEHHIWIRLVVEAGAGARVNCTVSCSGNKTTTAQ